MLWTISVVPIVLRLSGLGSFCAVRGFVRIPLMIAVAVNHADILQELKPP
jgi:hypothetical protein